MAAANSISVAGVTKRYGHHRALAKVDMRLEAGHLCALLGPNGAGKSTLMGIVSTLVRPSAGTVEYTIDGTRCPHGPRLRSRIGVLAHEAFIYSELSALENLRFYGRLYGVADLDQRVESLLDEVALEPSARGRAAGTYSRGMLQRLALARALLHDPPVLLLDEPFTGLDRTGAAALARTLRRVKSEDRVVLVVSHDFEALAGVCDHIVVLRRGKKVLDERRGDGGFSFDDMKDIYHQFDE